MSASDDDEGVSARSYSSEEDETQSTLQQLQQQWNQWNSDLDDELSRLHNELHTASGEYMTVCNRLKQSTAQMQSKKQPFFLF